MRKLIVLGVLLVACSVTVRGLSQADIQRLDSNRLLLTGSVEMQIGGWRIRADQVDVRMDEMRFVASGNVVVTSRERATDRQADVATNDSRLVMSGHVVVVSEGVRLTSDRIEIDRATGTLYAATIDVNIVANP